MIRLVGVALDCPDPAVLAAFYRDLLDGQVLWTDADSVGVQVPGGLVQAQRVPNHQPPTWPSGSVPKQLHLDIGVDELDSAEARAVALGATPAGYQPAPERWRVLLDPAGHPFCLTTVFPRT